MKNERAETIACRSFFLFAAATLFGVSVLGAGPVRDRSLEPNIQTASEWWPDLTDYWTPVGWKHHRFRYNVFFDGTIYADPALSQTAQAWSGQGVQLRVRPLAAGDSAVRERLRTGEYELIDDRRCLQGWAESKTPVLWTEWSVDGLLLRQSVFAFVSDAAEVQTGTEPLFAWVRYSVHETIPGLTVPNRYAIALRFNSPHVRPSMAPRQNIRMQPDRAVYPRTLVSDTNHYSRATGLRILEPDGTVRLAMAPGASVEAAFLAGNSKGKDPLLYFEFETKQGAIVDVLVPMIPMDRDIVERKLKRGYDKALAEADAFWARRPATAANIHVPETYINDTIRHFEQFAEVLSERVPETGMNVSLSGSLAYVRIWATPTGKMVSMFLDPLGYHDLATEFLEPFIEAQGTRQPPSPALNVHPGYLGSPERFKSIDWMADHGSLLFAIANHALLISDPKAKNRYVEPVVKACEFIHHARRVTGHEGVKGILPPARYSDRPWLTQGVWSDGWNYKGLSTAVRFLKQIEHPRANEFANEAEDYKKTFLAAFRQACRESQTWIDPDGKIHPVIPTSLHGHVDESARHGFYLDTGPLILVFAGLMDADDPLMQSAVKWFREGPPQRFARVGWTYTQVGFLRHEMSSCIPGYSWNIFHTHQLGDRFRFLEGMYSQYAGAISRQTRTVCETRGGITGRITHADTPFYMARLAVVDDIIADNELHLLRLCPLAWISSEKESRFDRLPTAYGPVNLRWQLSKDGKTLRVDFEPSFHAEPERIVLHIPPIDGVKNVQINGKRRSVSPGAKLAL